MASRTQSLWRTVAVSPRPPEGAVGDELEREVATGALIAPEPASVKRLNLALVFLVFMCLAVVQTWPLALHIHDHAIAWPNDSYVMWWNMAWFKESLVSFSNPFQTDALFYPQGTNLYLHTLTPVIALITMPLQLVTGGNLLLSWNIVMLVFFGLSGLGGYMLCYHVTKERWMSLLGGLIFTFTPHVMMQLHGHFHIASTWPIPFFALSLIRFLETGSRRDLFLVALLAALVTWNWFEFAIDLGLFALLAFAFWAALAVRRGQAGETLRLAARLLPGVALWAILSAPVLIPSALAVQDSRYIVAASANEAVYYSPDLLAYVTPSPLWGPGEYSENYGESFSTLAGSIETTMYLGLVPLSLALIAIVYSRRSQSVRPVLFWSLVFAFFAVMAMGPRLHVLAVDTGIPLPFRLFQEVPFAGERRVPGRMIIVGALALGVLATFGAAFLVQKLPRSSHYASAIACCLLSAMVLFEYWSPPVNLATYDVPPVYKEIGREPGRFAVLDLPLGRVTGNVRQGDATGGGMSDYAQVFHGKAAIGGYVSRAKQQDLDWLREQPGLGYLSCLDCPGYPREIDLDRDQVRSLFADLDVKYVVVNFVTFEGDPTILASAEIGDDVRMYVEETAGFAIMASGDGWVAYRNPAVE